MSTSQQETQETPRKHIASFKTENDIRALVRLKEISMQLLPEFGDIAWPRHSLVTQNVAATARTLFLNDIYKSIIDVPGVICEFGVQWGGTLTQLSNLRAIYEPFNHSRTIYGFDTFTGFPSTSEKDGNKYKVGDLGTIENHEDTIDEILDLIESLSPLPGIKKHQLIKGDVCQTFAPWLDDNPHAIIALAFLDMDLYEPTKAVLSQITPRLTKGSVLVFDELNCKAFPGETVALREVFGLDRFRLRRSAPYPFCTWAVYEG